MRKLSGIFLSGVLFVHALSAASESMRCFTPTTEDRVTEAFGAVSASLQVLKIDWSRVKSLFEEHKENLKKTDFSGVMYGVVKHVDSLGRFERHEFYVWNDIIRFLVEQGASVTVLRCKAFSMVSSEEELLVKRVFEEWSEKEDKPINFDGSQKDFLAYLEGVLSLLNCSRCVR